VLGLPSPDDVASAAANVFDVVFRGGLADLRRMPATLVDQGPQRNLYRYLPVEAAPQHERPQPVLLVPPLAAPAICFDLRRGCSLSEHLLHKGRRTYLLDYGRIEFSDRDLGLEHWFEDVVPEAIRRASADSGGEPVHVVGWCLGGILALLSVAADAALPVASMALVASPFDFSKVPLVAPLRPIDAVTKGRVVTSIYRALGGAPAPVVRAGYQLAGIDKYLMKPVTIATSLHDRELLSQIEAVDDFMANMHAYPGRTFGQLYHRFFRINDLADGSFAAHDRTLHLEDVQLPLLAIAGAGDGIAPVAACHHLADLVDGVRLETAPGGHLGVLTGRAARDTTWRLLDEFADGVAAARSGRAAKRAPRKRRASDTAARKRAASAA
jgi:polyhydroxyalkanoate synthase subunit PhaC